MTARALRSALSRLLTAGDGSAAEAMAQQATGLMHSHDSAFNSTLQADRLADVEMRGDRAELLERLQRGLVDPAQPPLVTAYGPGAAMAIDFAVGVARVDEAANMRLRVERELPHIDKTACPGLAASDRELDLVCWDMALAAGRHRLLRAPAQWWHTALVAPARLSVSRYTMQPRHLAMARALAREPMSPAELFRQYKVSLVDLRAFVQACLFLGLVQWVQPEAD